MRTGIADLPLHRGKAPKWLFNKMVKLSKEIVEIIIEEFSYKEFLKRLSNPYWFQGLGCLLGFDWHSSGLTTVTLGALKEAINKENYPIAIAGGKGKESKKVKEELVKIGDKFNLSDKKIEKLREASMIIAKIDNSCIQDNFNLYHHSMVVDEEGNYAVIQQGMYSKYARRYHWLSFEIKSFFDDKEKVASNLKLDKVLNLASKKSKEARKTMVDIANDGLLLRKNEQLTLKHFFKKEVAEEKLSFPSRHQIKTEDLSKSTLNVFKKIKEMKVGNFKELIKVRGVGRKALRALALTANLIYGTPLDWKDPVKYSFAHGGKDGIPFPVNKKVYANTIMTLKEIASKLKDKEKENALKRLNKLIK